MMKIKRKIDNALELLYVGAVLISLVATSTMIVSILAKAGDGIIQGLTQILAGSML